MTKHFGECTIRKNKKLIATGTVSVAENEKTTTTLKKTEKHQAIIIKKRKDANVAHSDFEFVHYKQLNRPEMKRIMYHYYSHIYTHTSS